MPGSNGRGMWAPMYRPFEWDPEPWLQLPIVEHDVERDGANVQRILEIWGGERDEPLAGYFPSGLPRALAEIQRLRKQWYELLFDLTMRPLLARPASVKLQRSDVHRAHEEASELPNEIAAWLSCKLREEYGRIEHAKLTRARTAARRRGLRRRLRRKTSRSSVLRSDSSRNIPGAKGSHAPGSL